MLHCWEEWPMNWDAKTAIVVSHIHGIYTSRLPWVVHGKVKPPSIRLALYGNYIDYAEGALTSVDELQQAGVDVLLTSADERFIANSVSVGRITSSLNCTMYSIPFGANPLRHLPSPVLLPRNDFVLLNSANFDKARRYYDYLYKPIKSFSGVIAGQGWPWTKNYQMNWQRDRYMYAQAKLAINLHLEGQCNAVNELNERTYILMAMGLTQVMDKPGLLPFHFPDYPYSSDSCEEFCALLATLLNERTNYSINQPYLNLALNDHNTFERSERLLNIRM